MVAGGRGYGPDPRGLVKRTARHGTLHRHLPERPRRFRQESGLSWSEIARLPGTYRNIVWRWMEGPAFPNRLHVIALLDLDDSMAPGHVFTD